MPRHMLYCISSGLRQCLDLVYELLFFTEVHLHAIAICIHQYLAEDLLHGHTIFRCDKVHMPPQALLQFKRQNPRFRNVLLKI